MSDGKPRQPLVELIRSLLRLYGTRTTKLAEYDSALRKRSLEQIKRMVGPRAAAALADDEYLEDPELELRVIARSIASLPPAARLKLVEALPGATRDAVRNRIFAFEDLLHIDSLGIQKVLARLDTATTALALVGASQALTRAVFRNLSRRAAQLFREEIEYRQGTDEEEIARARARVARTIMQLSDSGEIRFAPAFKTGKTGDDTLR